MSRPLRFTLIVLAGLGLLVLATSFFVSRTIEEWVDRDLSTRSQLALRGARPALVTSWITGSADRLGALLTDLTRDERVVAAAACTRDGNRVAATSEWPAQVTCAAIAPRVRPAADAPGPQWAGWNDSVSVGAHDLYLSALPVSERGEPVGFLMLLHDRGFAEPREAQLQRLLVGTFAVLACAASLLTIILTRVSWRGWTNEIRRVLRGGMHKPEFQPLLKDVRELVDRLSLERELDGTAGTWTPQRLKDSLKRYLLGERVVVLANREPYIHDFDRDGQIVVHHPASGLVTALEPVMRACSGVWIAHGSGTADRETVDSHDHVHVPPGEDAYLLRRVWLTEEEERGYYYGFANEGLWPLCHVAHTRPTFRSEDWAHYQAVNRKFAEAALKEVDADDPIILVQDYHFALAPRMIRERLPKATIITFWHVPWPNFERLGICPWSEELLDGLLGSSILGFHTQFHCNNFFDSVDRYLEARIDREFDAVVYGGMRTLVRPYPISIDWPNRWAQGTATAEECRKSVIAELRLRDDARIGVGVDRLDYTKGIEERLLAVERLLEVCPEHRGVFTFVQAAAPSRSTIPEYQAIADRVEAITDRVNKRFGDGAYRPIILRRRHHEPPEVFRLFKAADLCYVSSLHDGMNLVAKEFVAARDDERGVLVLSSFTGASRELAESLIVNPYDLDEAAEAMAAALVMPVAEQRVRMHAMRAFVAEFNIYRWAGRMLRDAERLRRRERLSGRFEGSPNDLPGLEA
ncbi:MAG: trehalose-6-phosphate synthase [Vicinamibacteria bacterium]|nr:trehalose-6-phosphate synthase [Vicinamibacteria bacterium]